MTPFKPCHITVEKPTRASITVGRPIQLGWVGLGWVGLGWVGLGLDQDGRCTVLRKCSLEYYILVKLHALYSRKNQCMSGHVVCSGWGGVRMVCILRKCSLLEFLPRAFQMVQ